MLLFAVVFQITTRNKNCMMGTRKEKKRTTNEEAIKKDSIRKKKEKMQRKCIKQTHSTASI